MRALTFRVLDPGGNPREALLVYFHAPEGTAPASAMTDASGVCTVELEPTICYRVSVENAVVVDGQPFPAGTVICTTVPEGEGPVSLDDVHLEFIDASRPALLDAIDALTARVATLEREVS